MTAEKTNRREERLDAQLKNAFDARAAEPIPEHIVDLVEDLETPLATKAG